MFEIGDILVSKFGYNCTLVTFYKVVGKTSSGKSVKIVELKSKIVDDDGYGQAGYVMPSNELVGNAMTKRIGLTFLKHNYVRINNYSYAYKWDGQKVHFDSYD